VGLCGSPSVLAGNASSSVERGDDQCTRPATTHAQQTPAAPSSAAPIDM
jgi:hypothetical protein